MCERVRWPRQPKEPGTPGPPLLPSGPAVPAPQSPKRGTPREVGRGSRWPTQAEKFGSAPISYHGRVLLSSSHLLPHRHLKSGQAPSPTNCSDNSAVTHFLPGDHTASSHPGTHFLLTASSIA